MDKPGSHRGCIAQAYLLELPPSFHEDDNVLSHSVPCLVLKAHGDDVHQNAAGGLDIGRLSKERAQRERALRRQGGCKSLQYEPSFPTAADRLRLHLACHSTHGNACKYRRWKQPVTRTGMGVVPAKLSHRYLSQ